MKNYNLFLISKGVSGIHIRKILSDTTPFMLKRTYSQETEKESGNTTQTDLSKHLC